MSGKTERLHAVAAANNYIASTEIVDQQSATAEDVFGLYTFNLDQMQARLPKPIFKSLKKTVTEGAPLDGKIADVVASAMKDWAIENGATHYAHVFYPLTGFTAEKHDGFLDPDQQGGAVAEFSGKLLIQGEPDASSFPNGGIRETCAARGYTAWDPTSFAYLSENENGMTLTIPTAFVSWTGEALDKKTPLLRSHQALDVQARRVLKIFGHKEESIARVTSFAGPEQEYFLVDRNFITNRPDLMSAGRTLFGAPSPKGQEFDDQYFGAIPDRVLAFMFDVERELYKLGIPAKTRHNEVAPGQFEIAPVFEQSNIASDHQQLMMTTFKKVALKHDFVCLLHEKPFAGINGSGKHCNFSVGNSTQGNFFDPGATPHDNAQFLVFCGAVIRAVHKHAPLLRAAIASAGNDHRLGANEAPPAIISIFLGDQLQHVWDQIEAGGASSSKEGGMLHIGVDTLPELPKDAGDRNRTSPFAFTGNRFEFRAVGSHQTIADPMTVINTSIADSLSFIADELEAKMGGDQSKLNDAVQSVLQGIIQEHGAVIFNGNGYSEEWHAEAARRGLPNLRTSVDAIPALESAEAVALFERHNVLSKGELEARVEILLELYNNSVNVEANLVEEMAETIIYPAAMRYQGELATTIKTLQDVGAKANTTVLNKVIELTDGLLGATADLKAARAQGSDTQLGQAGIHRDAVLPAMLKVREFADGLEAVVSDELWPLATYQEMLFIR